RDLHDGLGPLLAGLTLQLDAARGLLGRDTSRVDALLNELKNRTQTAVEDVRRLVYALRPPALDDLGLAAALRAAAAQYDNGVAGLCFDVEIASDLPGLPAAVEVAVYRITQEALANVVRHAHAKRCSVHVAPDARHQRLTLEVTDDGVGLDPAHVAGVGLHSMRERAAEVGGRCTIETISTGGTRVLAELPCHSPFAS
ncbi:MAG: sensor histidine kinase, partial [Chloroflexi bacterium]|nr:sensor histidine kinase [Chloroflexota bacterium]